MHRLVLLLAIVGAAYSQMVRQCTCQEFEPCKNSAVGNIMQCADQCQVSEPGSGLRSSLSENSLQIRFKNCLEMSKGLQNGALGRRWHEVVL